MDTKSGGQNLKTVLAVAALLAAFMVPGQAQATKTVSSPYVTKGKLSVGTKSGYDIDDDSQVDGGWKQKGFVGYGVTDYWSTQVEVQYKKSGTRGADAEFDEVEWENNLQLTKKGEYFIDAGIRSELVYNTSGGADKAKFKLMLAKETGDFTHKANVALDREFGEDSHGADIEADAAWSTKYSYTKEFEPGVEVHSDFGSISDGDSYSEQKHMAGPVAYGKIGSFGYDVGVLFGISDAAPDATLKAIFKYEWKL